MYTAIPALITHTMPLADINTVFDVMERAESIRGAAAFKLVFENSVT
jgi:Zn-dependent alcohol dehydrogenase